jgi:hypothetical protein
MRYLTKYKIFNEAKKPDNFIELKSLKYTLDPDQGILYPTLDDGNYYDDYVHKVGYEYREYIGISNEDIETIETYYKSTEELAKQNIDWELIKSIKELALDYLDKDYKLNIVIDAKMIRVYNVFYSHLETEDYYMRYFTEEWNKFLDVNKPENYYYTIRLLKPFYTHASVDRAYTSDRESGIEFVDELRKAFPEYSDKIDYGKW